MALPNVPGWIFDYPAARQIVDGPNANVKATLEAMCGGGLAKICYCEATDFRKHDELRALFCGETDCILDLEPEIIEVAKALPNSVNGKRLLVTDNHTKMIVATAIVQSLGLISAKSGALLTVVELASARGVTALTVEQFAAAL